MVTVRPLHPADLPAVTALCTSALVHDEHAELLPALLLRPAQPRTALVSLAEPGGPPAGVCFFSSEATRAEHGYLDLLAVRPEAQQHGHGRNLLAAAETALRARGAQHVHVAGHPPHYAWPGVDTRELAALALLDSAGYRRGRAELTLQVSLDTAPLEHRPQLQQLDAAGVTVRTLTADDHEWVVTQLGTHWQHTWVSEAAAALDTSEAGLVVAVQDETIIGFCAYGVNRPGEVGPQGTLPQHRHRGIGSTLIRVCLSAQRTAGRGTADLVWAGPLAYFSRQLHARTHRTFLTYTKELG